MPAPVADAHQLSRLVAYELAVDRAHATAHARQTARQGGVAWSGLAAEPASTRSPIEAVAAARTKLTALETWRASASGRFLEAVAETQRAAAQAHAAGETARAALSRGSSAELARCIAAADDMAAQALAASRAARRALRVAHTADPT